MESLYVVGTAARDYGSMVLAHIVSHSDVWALTVLLFVILASIVFFGYKLLPQRWRQKYQERKGVTMGKKTRKEHVKKIISDAVGGRLVEIYCEELITADELNEYCRKFARSLGLYELMNRRVVVHQPPLIVKTDIMERRACGMHKPVPLPDAKNGGAKKKKSSLLSKSA